MTTDDMYFERGINLRHGYLTEYYVEDAAYIVTLPGTLREVGVLLEPLTVAEKALNQAYEIQRRLKVWQPRRAAVVGAGTIGLLATLAMRLPSLDLQLAIANYRPPLSWPLQSVAAVSDRRIIISSLRCRFRGRLRVRWR